MEEVETIVMQACHDGMKMKNPTLYEAVRGLVSWGQSAKAIDQFMAERLLLLKGSPLRDSIYYTALYLKAHP